MPKNKTSIFLLLAFSLSLLATQAHASQLVTENYAGRNAIIYVPSTLPASGSRALVVVLHGGLGNAQRISSEQSESALNMNAVADTAGFVVAYLNGTPVARFLGADKLGWNAGKCCGLPAEKNIDDLAYIQTTVHAIADKYGIDERRIYGVGHSNGAMMTQKIMCETSLYAAAVPISGTLENNASICSPARGKRLMAIHGAEDRNVPIIGGKGSKGISRTLYASEAATAEVWQRSGASYDLQIIKGADHSTDAINARIVETESKTLAQKIAQYFGF
ncbi:MAG: prolyl oligopeptidase family serine peptidase [Pseudomonadota bacterium]